MTYDREEEKQKAKAARNQPHTLKVGNILVSSWGCNQTNIDFYKILSTTAKSIKMVEIGQIQYKGTGFMCESVVPDTSNETGKIELHRVDGEMNEVFLRQGSARIWSGKPMGQSHYA
jgi:hypothetical protein